MDIFEKIRVMPKTELHLHLEGAIPLELFLKLIHRKEPQHQIRTISDLRSKFHYADFREFIMTWIWMTEFLTKEEDFEEIAYRVSEELIQQNVKVAEVFFSPFDYAPNNLDPVGITESVIRGIKRARKDFSLHISAIVDIVRNHTYEPATTRFQRIEHLEGSELIGIGLGGSENRFPNELFSDVFKEARKKGFHTVAHAGEAAGAESVESAVELLKAERIGHGIRILEDEKLVKKMAALQIPFEVCPTSNVETKVVQSFDHHPIKKMISSGLNVTVNSDDPTFFQTSITHEFHHLVNRKGFMWNDIKQLAIRGVESSFLESEEKKKMRKKFEEELNLLD